LTDLVRASGRSDPALDQALSRYLVIRSAGLIESIRDDVADLYIREVAHARAHRRITSGLRQGQGARPKQLLDFLRSFDPAWAEEFALFIDQDDARVKDSLGALIAARTKIAHGDGEAVSISHALRWADVAKEVSDWLIRRFEP
jgi:hypothetical protein